MFTYKLDIDGYLLKYKARLVVQGDLQRSIYKETYAATLVGRIFRVLIAIAAYFDLEIVQFDAINTFTNLLINKVIHIEFPNSFKVHGKLLLLQQALYGLKRSLLL